MRAKINKRMGYYYSNPQSMCQYGWNLMLQHPGSGSIVKRPKNAYLNILGMGLRWKVKHILIHVEQGLERSFTCELFDLDFRITFS